MPDFSSLPLVIEPSDLNERLDESELILVDVGRLARFAEVHIPRAVCIEPSSTQCLSSSYLGLLPHKDKLMTLFAALGHHKDAVYVVYDDEGGGWAGRFIWLLDSIGHKNYHYLNGGLHAWKADGYPLTQNCTKTTFTTPDIDLHKEHTASLDYIRANLGNNDIVIWDARSPDEYNAEKIAAKKGGHIPSAINFEWTQAMDAKQGLRIRSDIKEHLVSLGITSDKEVIVYCQTHHRSGFAYLILKALGYPKIKAYAGSWGEWGNHSDTPVEP